MIGQSESKIKPHREDRLSGPEVGAKTCPLERRIEKVEPDFSERNPQICLRKRSCTKTNIFKHSDGDRIEIRASFSWRLRQVCFASVPLRLCANFGTWFTHAIGSHYTESITFALDYTDVESYSHTDKLVDRRFVFFDFLFLHTCPFLRLRISDEREMNLCTSSSVFIRQV